MSSATIKVFLPDEPAMLQFAEKLAHVSGDTAVIFLQGPLGAGKTTFSRGFLRGKGYSGVVKSPTYTLVEPYQLDQAMLFHFDFYRLQAVEELEFIGIRDYFIPQAICLIEWPEQAESVLPAPDLTCYIQFCPEGRAMTVQAHTECGIAILQRCEHEK